MGVTKRAILLILVYMAISVSHTVLPEAAFAVHHSTIRVPRDYPTVGEAVEAANPGDTILVAAGTYREYVYVNKSLRIIGEGAEKTVVSSFEITADNVTVNGFDVWDGLWLTYSSGCNVSNNIVWHSFYPIVLDHSSNNYVAYNTIPPTGEGIYLFDGSNNNVIRQNNIAGQQIAIHVFYSHNNTIDYNRISESCTGIYINGGQHNRVESNKLAQNKAGIAIGGSYNLMISNLITDNSRGISCYSGKNNSIYHNNFLNNPGEVVDNGKNAWDNGAEGNYWDGYNGTDLNGDGVGDTCLPWQEVDYYPLMAPWTLIRTFYVDVNGMVYPVRINCSSTVASFNFDASLRQMSFNVTGPPSSLGFCSVTIPKALLSGDFAVFVDDELVTCTQAENATHTFTYFTYAHSTGKVRILVPIPGDLNVDGDVDIFDIVLAASSYGVTPDDPNWNPLADLAPPWEIINIYDIVTLASYYEKS